MNVGLTGRQENRTISGARSVCRGIKARGTSGMATKIPATAGTKGWETQDTARPGHHRELQGTLTANVRPQLVVIVLEQRVEDLCGISLLCLGGEDPGFVDAEVIVIVFLCAVTPAGETQRAGTWLWQLCGTPWQQGHGCVSEMPKEEDAEHEELRDLLSATPLRTQLTWHLCSLQGHQTCRGLATSGKDWHGVLHLLLSSLCRHTAHPPGVGGSPCSPCSSHPAAPAARAACQPQIPPLLCLLLTPEAAFL